MPRKDLFDGVYRYKTFVLEDLVPPRAEGDLIAISTSETRATTYVATHQQGKLGWLKLQDLALPHDSESTVIRGFAPGVDGATNTFTCPRCRRSRDCQTLNPLCLACGYQDPRCFEPAGGYEIMR